MGHCGQGPRVPTRPIQRESPAAGLTRTNGRLPAALTLIQPEWHGSESESLETVMETWQLASGKLKGQTWAKY